MRARGPRNDGNHHFVVIYDGDLIPGRSLILTKLYPKRTEHDRCDRVPWHDL